MTYVNCALIPVPEDAVETYRALSGQMAEVWLDHGARSYREFLGEDLDVEEKGAIGFPELAELSEDETVILAVTEFESREDRDEVEAKVMQDERVGEIMADGPPFDPSRIAGGGFELLVEG